MSKRSFWINFTVPCASFLLAVYSEYAGLDFWLSRHFYDLKLGVWPYRSHWLMEDVLHRGGRNLVVAMAIGLSLLFIGSFFRPRLKPYRKDFAFVLVAGLSGPAIVGTFKALTHIYSPWDLLLLGGSQPYIRIFDHVPANSPVGHAFPAAHASGGFAWFSVFFALRRRAVPGYRLSLILPLVLGFIFGVAQQVRGAHFLSHDLVSLGTCWLCAALWFRLFYAHAPESCVSNALPPSQANCSSGNENEILTL
jgi:membrane-associated PAP2 superfamily phosphatase